MLKSILLASWLMLACLTSINASAATSITALATPSTAMPPASVTLSIAVNADPDPVTVTQVEYFNGITPLGVSAIAPFSLELSQLPAGTYSIVAKATISNAESPVLVSDASPLIIGGASGAGQNVYYVQADHLDTPRAITDQGSTLVWTWASDPFGSLPPTEKPGAAPAFTFNQRFPGQYYDKETNLHYNYHRDYDPQTGRYIQSDPIGLRGGINSYTYVSNGPLTSSDPFGLVRKIDPKGQECVALKEKIARKKEDINKRIQECAANRGNLPYYPPYPGAPPRMSVQGHEEIIRDLKDSTQDDEKLYDDKCGGGGTGTAPVTNAEAAKKAAGTAAGLGATYWIISEGLRIVFPPRNLIPIP